MGIRSIYRWPDADLEKTGFLRFFASPREILKNMGKITFLFWHIFLAKLWQRKIKDWFRGYRNFLHPSQSPSCTSSSSCSSCSTHDASLDSNSFRTCSPAWIKLLSDLLRFSCSFSSFAQNGFTQNHCFVPKRTCSEWICSEWIYSELLCAQTGFAQNGFAQKVLSQNYPCLKLDLLRKDLLRKDLLRKDLLRKDLLRANWLRQNGQDPSLKVSALSGQWHIMKSVITCII
jgi:hypothetical protein